jgi:hypothetical protein
MKAKASLANDNYDLIKKVEYFKRLHTSFQGVLFSYLVG